MPTLEHRKERIPEHEIEGKRLGRHLSHDPKSFNYPIDQFLDKTKQAQTKSWKRYVKAFDQGNLGSCTGNAAAGMLATSPLHVTRANHGPMYDEDLAIQLYEKATTLDEFGGTYPPNDTGSSTLGVLKAAQAMGLIKNYYWGFGIVDMQLTVSQIGPVIVGTNWYEGMDNPNNGMLRIAGSVRGGHEYEIEAIDIQKQAFQMCNSWGPDWGDKGRAWISFHDMDRLLGQGGEVGIGRAA